MLSSYEILNKSRRGTISICVERSGWKSLERTESCDLGEGEGSRGSRNAPTQLTETNSGQEVQ